MYHTHMRTTHTHHTSDQCTVSRAKRIKHVKQECSSVAEPVRMHVITSTCRNVLQQHDATD